MAVKVGINGFGRIGRLVFRAMLRDPKNFDIVAINDLSDGNTLAYLLKYDSIHRTLDADVSGTKDTVTVNGKTTKILAEKDPSKLPWGQLGVQVVLESTGFFTARQVGKPGSPDYKAGYDTHLAAGAKKVVISAPTKDEPDATIVLGVNNEKLTKDVATVSNASCTTNCLAPVAKVLHEKFGIVKGLMTTVHAYTNDQRILDQIHKDPRRARAAGLNIIPTTTGAARAVGKVIPALKGKLDGFAMRVPVGTGSVVDLTCELNKDVTAADINAAIKAAAEGELKGILQYTEDPIVSSDVIGNQASSVFDALSTITMPKEGGKFVKVVSWYDNEWGYSCRTADLIKKLGEMI
jgi:glyceraldehyde 3-phosphate dehydrogenase